MITYERLCDLLVESAQAHGLWVTDSRHFIALPTTERTFEMVVVPVGWQPPHDIRARLDFTWDAAYTSITLYDQDDLCSLYHDEHEDCPHQKYAPHIAIELEIRYEFTPPEAGEAPEIAGALRRILGEQIPSPNLPEIKFEISYVPDSGLVIHDAFAFQVWTLEGEDLMEEPDLSDIFEEIQRLLWALYNSGYFHGQRR